MSWGKHFILRLTLLTLGVSACSKFSPSKEFGKNSLSSIGGGSGAGTDEKSQCAPASTIRHLTADEAGRLFANLLGIAQPDASLFPEDPINSKGYKNSGTVQSYSSSDVEQMVNVVESALNTAFQGQVPPDFRSCYNASTDALDVACASAQLPKFLRKAYRRPSTSDQQQIILQVLNGAGATADGLRQALFTALLLPQFWLVIADSQLNAGMSQMSSYDLAERLALFLWGSYPDDELARAADANELIDNQKLLSQLDRMLADPKSSYFVEQFASQWLQLNSLMNIPTTQNRFAGLPNGILSDMKGETTSFINYIINSDRPISEILNANYSFLNSNMAAHYGVTLAKPSTAFVKTDIPANLRRGILGQASFLTQNADDGLTSTVHRGVFVYRKLLCQTPPPPPPGVSSDPIFNVPGKMPVEMAELRMTTPRCMGCHQQFEPHGVMLEGFDSVGKSRTQYVDGAPVVTQANVNGTMTRDFDQDVDWLANNPTFGLCMADQLSSFFTEKDVALTTTNDCQYQTLKARKDLNSLSIKQLIREIVSSPDFRRL